VDPNLGRVLLTYLDAAHNDLLFDLNCEAAASRGRQSVAPLDGPGLRPGPSPGATAVPDRDPSPPTPLRTPPRPTRTSSNARPARPSGRSDAPPRVPAVDPVAQVQRNGLAAEVDRQPGPPGLLVRGRVMFTQRSAATPPQARAPSRPSPCAGSRAWAPRGSAPTRYGPRPG